MISLLQKLVLIALISAVLYYSFTFLAAFSKANPYHKSRLRPDISFAPPQYVCLKKAQAINLDGNLEEKIWKKIPKKNLVDIKNREIPQQSYLKMFADSQYWYIALYDQDVSTKKLELFLDHDNDTHDYLYVVFEDKKVSQQLFNKAPQNGGKEYTNWHGEKIVIKNRKRKDHQTWEIAMPLPKNSHQNYCRFNLAIDEKVWAASGNSNLHFPEIWGFVYFDENKGLVPNFAQSPDEQSKWQLREVFYAQKAFYAEHQKYSPHLKKLFPRADSRLRLEATENLFEAKIKSSTGRTWAISHEGKVWQVE